MKRLVRIFSLWLNDRTRKWVVPSAIWTKLDNGDVSAKIDLSDIAVKWGTLDPEFVRANLLLRKVEYHANDVAVAQQPPQAAGSRFVCTAESPMPKNASGCWQHPDAKSDPINDSIYYDHYDCPHCGLHFTVEVAE